jgi:uncharacterized protein with beta-barrel porin domain
MHRIYRPIWSNAHKRFVTVYEISKSRGKGSSNSLVQKTLDSFKTKASDLNKSFARLFRWKIIYAALGLFVVLAPKWAWGQVCQGNTTISSAVTTTQNNSSWACNFTVDGNGSISTTGSYINGVFNSNTITTLNNIGSISTTGDSAHGILQIGGLITTLNNIGLISTSNDNAWGIYNISSNVTTLTNSGSISTTGANNAHGLANVAGSTITTLANTGSISTNGSSSQGILMIGSSITTLNNSGSISTSNSFSNGIYNDNTSVITTINNTGSISSSGNSAYGILNLGSITTLNNQQGRLGNNPLTLSSNLPTNYNIIVASSTNFGQLSISNSSSLMAFGISNLSTTSSLIVGQTLAGVLQGFNGSLASYLSNSLVTSSNGYTYALTQQGSTGTWDLTITACSVCSSSGDNSSGGSSSGGGSSTSTSSNISAGTSVGLSSLGVTANPTIAGGTLVLSNGDSSRVSIAITSAGGTIQAPTSGSATLSGVFSGPGSLTFTSSVGAVAGGSGGTIVLSGANTYSGGTTVSDGTLVVAGPSPTGTGDVFVASAGTLMGTGTIAGNSIVSGVLKPGNSPGYLSFTQNLTLNAGSTYQQDIAGSTQASSATPVGASGYYSFVNVGSQLTITSGATLTPRLSNLFAANEAGYGSTPYTPVLGDRFRMITATGGISGRFSTLTQPAELTSGTQFIAFYNVNGSNSLDLAVTPTSYSSTLSSSTTNAREVANVLDQILGVNKTGNATAAQDSLLYSVAGQTAASLPGFAQALSGEIHAASAATLPQATQRVQQAVLARLGDFPMPPTQLNGAWSNTLSSGAITGNNPSGLPTANVSSNPAVNPNAANITSAAITDGRAWGEIAYQRGERSGNSGGNGFNNNLYQAVFGVDAYTNAALGLKLGGGLALSNTTVNATGGNSTIQQGALFLYGKMPVAEDYVLDGMLSLGLSSTNLSRSDVTGISNGFSNKSVMGNDVLVSAGLSRPFETSDVRITPYVRLTYQYVGQAAYDEGASAAALNVGRMNANGVRAVIGVGAGSLNKDPVKEEYTYRANLAIGADSQGLLNPILNTTLGGFSSSVTTPTAGSTFVQAGLYGTIKVADSAYAYAGVSAEARTGQTLYGGSVGLRVAF